MDGEYFDKRIGFTLVCGVVIRQEILNIMDPYKVRFVLNIFMLRHLSGFDGKVELPTRVGMAAERMLSCPTQCEWETMEREHGLLGYVEDLICFLQLLKLRFCEGLPLMRTVCGRVGCRSCRPGRQQE